MKKVIEHSEAVKLLGYKHESEIQTDLHDFRNVINASDVINVVRFLTQKGYSIKAHNQFAGDGWIENTITHLQGKIEPDADKQYFGSEYTKGRNNAFRLVITLLKKHLPSPPQNTKES